jgi:hypothetical protein
MSPTRIEFFDRQSVVSLRVRIPRVFVPHLVLMAVIVLSSLVGVMMTAMRWIAGA